MYISLLIQATWPYLKFLSRLNIEKNNSDWEILLPLLISEITDI